MYSINNELLMSTQYSLDSFTDDLYLKFTINKADYVQCPILMLQLHNYFGEASIFVHNGKIPTVKDFLVSYLNWETQNDFSGTNLVGKKTLGGYAQQSWSGPGEPGTF